MPWDQLVRDTRTRWDMSGVVRHSVPQDLAGDGRVNCCAPVAASNNCGLDVPAGPGGQTARVASRERAAPIGANSIAGFLGPSS